MTFSGIDYTHKAFLDENGESRIFSIWDQTAMPENPVNGVEPESVLPENPVNETERQNAVGNSISDGNIADGSRLQNQPPEGFLYGVEYTKEQINTALASENPLAVVPQTDTNGHGTFLASVAAGSPDAENDFTGAAPLSELIVVKLKEAKQNLRDFFYLSETEPIYQENDIMTGMAYLERIANRENRPLVILLGLGSNQGSHAGDDPLSITMDVTAIQQKRAIVIASGNEAAARHHFFGKTQSLLAPVTVEINVEADIRGFCMELWSYAPELVRVVVQSPTGQQSQAGFPLERETQTTNFIFENTTLTLDYRIAGRGSGHLLVFFRFTEPTEGIWTVLVYPENSITGEFHMWLPIQPQVGRDVTFIRPNPDTTITTPSAAIVPITVGGYDGLSGAIYLASGRGFDARGRIKPDLCAPCVNVFGAGRANQYTTYSGTSAAAAITAGAAAQCLEWGILRRNVPAMNSVEVKNLLIRGCQRENNVVYPNTEWGYGKLDVYRAFEVLRN